MTATVLPNLLAASDSGSSGGISSILLFVPFLIIVGMVIMKNRRQRQEQVAAPEPSSFTPGADVMTAGGLFGVVREVRDDSVIMEIAPGVNVRYLSAAVSLVPQAVPQDDPQNVADEASPEDEQSPQTSA